MFAVLLEILVIMANMNFGDDPSCGIKKKVLHASRAELPTFPDGTKVPGIIIGALCSS